MSHYSGSIPDTLPRRQDWLANAACIGHADEMHPDNNERGIARAKNICSKCPVTRECFWDAVATGDMEHGIRAGMRAKERRDRAAQAGIIPTADVEPPKPRKPREPRPATLAEAFARRAARTHDGHVVWTGTSHLQQHGKRYTALQAAFIIGHGRDPEGIVRRTCTHQDCHRWDHLADAVIRDSKVECGTRKGYLRHRRLGEDCERCRKANTDKRMRQASAAKELVG